MNDLDSDGVIAYDDTSLLPTPSHPVVFVYGTHDKQVRSVPAENAHLIRFEDGRPIRKIPKYRGKVSTSGFYWSATDGRHLEYDSDLEKQTMLLLDLDPDVVAMAEQPLEIRALHRGGTWRHVPDLFVRWGDGTPGLIDVKNPTALLSTKTQLQLTRTEEVCEANGLRYEVRTTPDEAFFVNVDTISFARRPADFDQQLIDEILVAAQEPILLGDLIDESSLPVDAFAVIAHLRWTGRLNIDLTSRLTRRHLVVAANA